MKSFISILFSLAVLTACEQKFDWTNLEGTWILEKENNFCGNDTSMTWTPNTNITLKFGPKFEFTKTITGTCIFKGQYSVDKAQNKITFTILQSTFFIVGTAYTDSSHSHSKEEIFVTNLRNDTLIAFGLDEKEIEIDSLQCGSISHFRKLKTRN